MIAGEEKLAANKVYHTLVGNFTEAAGKVYISETVNKADLIVPAQFAKNGQDTPLELMPNTVVLTEKEAKLGEVIERQLKFDSNFKENATSYLNDISLISSFANASMGGADGIATTRSGLSAADWGPSALQSNSKGSGFLQMTTQDSKSYLKDFITVDLENTNIQPAYIQAWAASVAAHELYHLKDSHLGKASVLAGEIEADHGSLKQVFNKDYKDFVMDMQALRSINFIVPQDDHATHIWSEEYDSGLMPTVQEDKEIMGAPQAIRNRAMNVLDKVYPDNTWTEVEALFSDPQGKYATLKVLREKDAFADIPFANEFVDKYLTAAERRYKAEYLEGSDVDKFRQDISAVEAESNVVNKVESNVGPRAPSATLGLSL